MRDRLIYGLGGLALLLPALLWGGVPAVIVIVAIAIAISVYEYAKMALPTIWLPAAVWIGVGTYSTAAAGIWAPTHVSAVWATFTLLTLIGVTLLPGDDLTKAADRVGRIMMGVAWIGLLGLLVRIRALDAGLLWTFVLLGLAWLGDTGAYFAGRFLAPKVSTRALYARISPKKTVVGMLGGIVTATLGTIGFARLGLPLTLVDCIVLGVLGCVAGVLGDLAESLFKRAFGVKDSGTIMPGHGGLLDRIDSVLFVGVVVHLYATYVSG